MRGIRRTWSGLLVFGLAMLLAGMASARPLPAHVLAPGESSVALGPYMTVGATASTT